VAFALIVARGSGRGRRYRFEHGASFGRDAANDVVLNQAGVSRVHARIERAAEGWMLLDRGSANGTMLNGAAVAGRARLHEGDRIGVGAALFEFRGARGAARLQARWRNLQPPGRATLIAGAVLLGGIATERAAQLLEVPFTHQGGARDAALLDGPPVAPSLASGPPAAEAGSLDRAQAAYERGLRKLRERRIAPRNLYDAWTAFADARGELERLGQRPGVLPGLEQSLADAERDLARECRRLLFSASRSDRYGESEKAQQAWREILLHFPGDDPAGCRRKARDNLVSTQPDDGAG
jgi:pSer/pThr/pTyr-binding forkhead associated (FHA) protein